MKSISPRVAAFDAALSEAIRRVAAGDLAVALALLERAHVLGQRDIGPHLQVHLRMLRVAWAMGDGREVRGQLLRIVLTPIGHLTRRLPLGNTGASNVSTLKPMVIPPDVERFCRG